MDSSFNRFTELVKIVAPAFWSVTITAAFVWTGDLIFDCIWPHRSKPDINTAVTCFLAPAGLVFALSFGFVFQMVLEKHSAVKDKITTELSMLDQMVTMVTKFNWPRQELIMGMLKAIKTELITTSMLVQNREASFFTNKAPPEVRVHIWSIIDLLNMARFQSESSFNLNAILTDRFVTYLLNLNSICTDRMGAMHTKIHFMKWVFLEFLGSMSVFGVMIIHASSPTMELTLCELTVFSTFMLFYLLADFDNSFNGFFRVDVSLIAEVVERARALYHEALVREQREQVLGKVPSGAEATLGPHSVLGDLRTNLHPDEMADFLQEKGLRLRGGRDDVEGKMSSPDNALVVGSCEPHGICGDIALSDMDPDKDRRFLTYEKPHREVCLFGYKRFIGGKSPKQPPLSSRNSTKSSSKVSSPDSGFNENRRSGKRKSELKVTQSSSSDITGSFVSFQSAKTSADIQLESMETSSCETDME